jgi:putative aminopeptidase FrvX
MNIWNKEKYYKYAKEIFTCDSPTGYTIEVIKLIENHLKEWGYDYKVTNKGNIEVIIDGIDNSKCVATSAHVDTLGLMVRSIKGNGNLALVALGGPITPTLDAEYCTILTRDNKRYSGTILSTSPATHVYSDANSKDRSINNLEVRIDEQVHSAKDVEKLGINNGDMVFIDTKFTITESDFIKSRFIDDKASACMLLLLLDEIHEKNIKPLHKTRIYFVVHEEVGHGASAIASEISEFVTLDMGCVGLDLAGNEYAVSICAKDSRSPYDYELTTRLINKAKELKLNYVVDIFPYYGSDVGAAWSAGHDFKGALIGPGVHASHGMERTHISGIENTYKLIVNYLLGL